jgi:hypothetical protein
MVLIEYIIATGPGECHIGNLGSMPRDMECKFFGFHGHEPGQSCIFIDFDSIKLSIVDVPLSLPVIQQIFLIRGERGYSQRNIHVLASSDAESQGY